jgi:dUTP pyrophosphatase
MKLFVKLVNPDYESFYDMKKNYDTDSGFDLSVPLDHIIPANAISYKIPLGVACIPDVVQGYYLYPRSSIIKTPLRLANSVGIIDSTYTGEIIAVVDNISDKEYTVSMNTRLFQLCAPDLKPFESITFVDELPVTERGSNGFGSSGK